MIQLALRLKRKLVRRAGNQAVRNVEVGVPVIGVNIVRIDDCSGAISVFIQCMAVGIGGQKAQPTRAPLLRVTCNGVGISWQS